MNISNKLGIFLRLAIISVVSSIACRYVNNFIFLKTIHSEIVETEEIKVAVDKIAGEYAHYF